MNLLRLACSIGFIRKVFKRIFSVQDDIRQLSTQQFGLNFKNPVGLGAGFDKNAKYLRELETLGFGFVEIGTVTPKPQTGNEKPRLFRLPADGALINRMGFNNDGVEVVADRLRQWREKESSIVSRESSMPDHSGKQYAIDNDRLRGSRPHSRLTDEDSRFIIGGNIGKNKSTSNEDAWKDYEICFLALHPYVDFFIVNVSSPNTPGLRALQEKDALRKILVNLQHKNDTLEHKRPILLKISPDLGWQEIDDVIDLASEIGLDGLVATNTTINRENLKTSEHEVTNMGAGGVSGQPLRKKSTEIVQYIARKTEGRIPVIASGGIFSYDAAKEKLLSGASLIEVWTGFIYEGPFIVKTICKKLV